MSAFNRFCKKAKRAAVKVGDKAEELVQSVSRSMKIKSLEMRVDEKYEELGKIVYQDLYVDECLEDQKLQIIAEIDALFAEIAVLKEETDEDVEDIDEEELADDEPAEEEAEKESE